jgi:lipopolysaccharide heptosyltransferase II
VPVHWNFTWLPRHREVAAGVIEKWQADTARWLILQPGARWVNKRWPIESFAELARQLAVESTELRFAILGGKADIPLGEIIARAAPDRCLDLTGKTSLLEMVEWIRLSELMVTNDTGPMHVAAALGKPVIALFGPTEPLRTGPYGQVHRALQLRSLPCVPCFKDTCAFSKPFECLRGLSPSSVFVDVVRHLAGLKR